MNTQWQSIAECLRRELAEYGELLRLFEEQQGALFARKADGVLRLAREIEDQARTLGQYRRGREQAVAQFALEHERPANSTLRSMLPLIEPDARPLLEALINEVNLLLHRVRRTSRHNHAVLARTLELHRETLRQLQPAAFTTTYSATGFVSTKTPQSSASLHAAG